MKKLCKMTVILLFGIGILYADGGLSQAHLVKTVPTPNNANVPPNITLSFTFDSTIIEESIEPDTLTLQQKEPATHISNGNLSLTDQKTLVFAPQEQLSKGIYTIQVNSFKLQRDNIPDVKPKTTWQKFIAWLCGLAYDDIRNCPLCQYVCKVQNYILTEPIHFNFEVKDDAPKIISLESDTSLIELSEHNTTQLHITATFDNNTTEDVTQKATYTSSDSSVDVENGTISTNQEGSATITVSYGGKTTEIQVEVYEMIEGHLLPHEPDTPDDTLLGVDANNNGVRDEVERWIFKEMPTYHHPEIERVIALTTAKAYQMALIDPTNKGDKVNQAMEKAHNCWMYYEISKDLPFDGTIGNFSNKLKDEVFNTKERLKTYFDYDYTLKGRTFWSADWSKLDTSYCEHNIDVMP